MGLIDHIVHLFDPPAPRCKKNHEEAERSERAKWREQMHANNNAATRAVGAFRSAKAASENLNRAANEAITEAERVAHNMIRRREQLRDRDEI